MRAGRSWLVAAALVGGCTEWDPPAPVLEPEPLSRLERTAAALGMVTAEAGGPDARVGGPTVWLMPDMAWFGPTEDAPLRPLAPVEPPGKRPDQRAELEMFHPLYDGVAEVLVGDGPFAMDVIVDGRVTMRTLELLMYWLFRAGVLKVHLIGGSLKQPRALVVENEFLLDRRWPPKGPPTAFKYDLALEWRGVDVWALARPRRAGSPPLGEEVEEPPPDSPDWRPDYAYRVPLALADGDPPLAAADIAALSKELCRLNGEPFGVALESHAGVPFAALMSAAVAAIPEPRCRGPLAVGNTTDPPDPREATVRPADLPAHVQASVPRPTPPSDPR